MKHFFSENLSSMTFVFSIIILLNAMLSYFQGIPWEGASQSILGIASLILILFVLGYAGSYLPIHSAVVYHVVNIAVQLVAFFVIASLTGLFSINLENVAINGLIYIGLYYLVSKIKRHRLNQLANAINNHLTKKD